MSSGLFVGVLLNRQSCRLLLSGYCWTDCRRKDILLKWGRERDPHLMKTWLSCWSSSDANFNEDVTLNWCWDATLWCDSQLMLRRDSQFKMWRSCWMLPDTYASAALDACPWTNTSIRSEQAQPFLIVMSVHRTDTTIRISLSMLD